MYFFGNFYAGTILRCLSREQKKSAFCLFTSTKSQGVITKIGICTIKNNHFWLYFKDLNVKLGNQAHQKIQLNIPDWNETKMENIDTSGIDAKMSLYLDLLNKKVVF